MWQTILTTVFMYDYIIVGQGICGTFLSWNLVKEGKKVLVIDESQPFSSTKVASGVINPVTGRQVVTTWMADDLLPFVLKECHDIGSDIGVMVIFQKNIQSFPPSLQMRQMYDKKIDENNFIQPVPEVTLTKYQQYFNFMYGCIQIDPCYFIDLHTLLKGWRQQLKDKDALLEERFDSSKLTINASSVVYENHTAEKLIFCNGINAYSEPYWSRLPYVMNKGQALVVDIPDLPQDVIYKFGAMTFVPWYDNLWWVGSSYENDFENSLPSEGFRKNTETALKNVLKLPFTICDHIAGIRPATVERRPFVGLHPQKPSIGIFDGMGTKGCSLAPYFAHQLTQHLLHGTPINAEGDVSRFAKVLAR
ncbi:MAG: FAD-binding oxidoreductase [Filimonas sp.]|nr:FAD-binding oxidoreductase [Filimonas sp.]